MATLGALPAIDIINGFKGTLDYYVYRGTPCVRRWPRKRSKPWTAAEKAQQEVFSAAVSLWNELPQEIRDAYKAMASGSTLSGRDLMVKMYINATTIYPGLGTEDYY